MWRFYGDGAVTKILERPAATAAEIDIPTAADFPLPLPAVMEMVFLKFLSETASIKVIIALAWSKVFAIATKGPIKTFD